MNVSASSLPGTDKSDVGMAENTTGTRTLYIWEWQKIDIKNNMNSCQLILNASRNNIAANYDRVRVIFLSEGVIRPFFFQKGFCNEIYKHRTE